MKEAKNEQTKHTSLYPRGRVFCYRRADKRHFAVLAGSPAAEKIVSLCLAIILILIGVSAITASSRIKNSGNADLRLTKK